MISFIRILKGVNCYVFDTDWYFKSFIETYAAIDVCPEKKATKHCFFFMFIFSNLFSGWRFVYVWSARERASGVTSKAKLSSSRPFQIHLILSVLCALLSLVIAFIWLLCVYANESVWFTRFCTLRCDPFERSVASSRPHGLNNFRVPSVHLRTRCTLVNR